MKKEDLDKFRKEYSTYVEAVDSGFSEIEKLQKELDEDPRVLQIKKLQEEIKNDPRKQRLKDLIEIQKDYNYQKGSYGYWGYTSSDYAYFASKPFVNTGDTYGVLLRYGPRDASTLGRIAQVDGMIYTYLDVENVDLFDKRVEDAEAFEKGHIIIPAIGDINEERVKKEFFLGCINNDPEEVAKQLVKKYSETAKEEE